MSLNFLRPVKQEILGPEAHPARACKAETPQHRFTRSGAQTRRSGVAGVAVRGSTCDHV
jgi:hypothetical protein